MADQLPEKRKSLTDLLTEMQPQFKAALPAHLKQNAERYIRVALTEYRRNPELQKCDPYTVLSAAMIATGLGLEVGSGGRAYLIPYKEQCTFVPGWRGLVEICQRSGRAVVWTGVIYEGQRYEYQQGDSPRLVITEDADDTDPTKIVHTYAIGRITGAEWPVIERWSIEKIRNHLERYNKVGRRHYAYENFEMYARKIPLMQVLKYMPYSPELEAAQILDTRAEHGRGLTVEAAADALEGVFERLPEDQPPQPGAETTPRGRKRPGSAKKKAEDQPPEEEVTKPASAEELKFIRTKLGSLRETGISEHDICKTFKIQKLDELRSALVPVVLKWLSDPASDPFRS